LLPHPITSVDLVVRDLDRSVDFYTRQVGLPAAAVSGPDRTAVLSAGPATLRLREVPGAAGSGWIPDDLQRGFRHVGFGVSDIDERSARLRRQGVPFRLDPTDAYGQVRIAFFYDPDGVLLEFVQGHLAYDRVHDDGLVRAAAAADAPQGPRFDHVATTVTDLDAAITAYRDALGFGVAGQLIRDDDPRGFVITYLHAGRTVLEVFSYRPDKQDSPWQADPPAAGFRDVAFAAGSAGAAADLARRLEQAGARPVPGHDGLYLDRDGLALRVEAAR
jgi:catechol 2,3-dioxygenase-like lactoylglutathione lyase family enzyme